MAPERGRPSMFALPLSNLLASQRWRRAGMREVFRADVADDPIRASVERGMAAGRGDARPPPAVREHARSIRRRALASSDRTATIRELLDLIRDYPGIEEFQGIVAQLLTEEGDEHALGACLGVSTRFPASTAAFDRLIKRMRQDRGAGAAREILRARFPRLPAQFDHLLAYAEACEAVGDVDQAMEAFARLSGIFAKRRDSWLLASAWLEEEFGAHRAAVILLRRLAAGAGLGPPLIGEDKHVHSVTSAISRDEPLPGGDRSTASVKVLAALFERILAERTETALAPTGRAGPVVLLTGSLGAGGAERQLVATAIGLNGIGREQRTLADGVTLDRVQVVARALDDREDGAFYLAELEQAGIPVESYREWPDFAGDLATSAVRPALRALGFLPWSTAEAVIKLTDRLRAMKPQMVHIWQDGLVYATGLAALLAGVPRIVLSGRSTPPPDRRERYLVEYDIIYKSLLRAPGVKLSVNSTYAASRYSRWLGIDPREILVVPNGVAPLATEGDAASEDAFRTFTDRTSPSSLTLGGVMRLDEVKRPLLWIEAAAAVAARIPDARFILVGGGPFRKRVEKRAEALGIASRCLFVGRSAFVGYWLPKMDILMLLSEHEGLPNVLIEAQLMGVPVVTTAAGGAPEALVHGRTGIVAPLHPSPADVAGLIADLVAQPDRLREMALEARRWTMGAFALSHMLSKTLEAYKAAGLARGVRPTFDEGRPEDATRGRP
ncbi:glycosyltransferase [Reyranella sp.]|uniref:glycosyltransferase n=1 Tax=Reyranella sp. TaxID=1929291 RepID=UPI003BADA7C4